MKKFISLFSVFLFSSSIVSAQNPFSIIPEPVSVERGTGFFEITDDIQISISEDSEEMQFLGEYIGDMIYPATWLSHKVQISKQAPKNGIHLKLDSNFTPEKAEAYSLKADKNGVTITAKTMAGLFYGVQTLRQLLPPEIEHNDPSLPPVNTQWRVPAVTITDYPRFEYRGMHLDVARHFFPVSFVKKYIDLLAMHKMNRFHWHLTEDQGWRIEIKKYPKLTEVGAWRDSTLIGHYGTDKYDNIRHGGYYTQEEIKDVVAYAQKRHITIIPEIEMPGHSSAALTAYPEFGCVDKKYKVQSTWGIFEDIYCPTEETFGFLEDVLTEVMELFPSKYIHIGGDEAPKKQWEESEAAQQVIAREGLKNENELQSYFVQRIEQFLNKHDRYIIGWDEILEGGLAPKATVMSWRGEAGGIEAAKMHHDVIMTPTNTNYFDYLQGDKNSEPLSIGGFISLKQVYDYEPIPDELTAKEAKFILGAQGNVWTEYMHTGSKVEYMVFPRATALAEVLWSPKEQKDWESFKKRLQKQCKRFDILGVNYAPHSIK